MGSPEGAEPNRFFSHFSAFVAVGVGLLVFAGWLFGIDSLINLVPGWPKMAALTALTFVVAGTALWLTSIHARRAGPLAAAIVTVIGVAMLARDFTRWDVHLEHFIRTRLLGAPDAPP